MKIFTQWSTDPFNPLFDSLDLIVIGTETELEADTIRHAIINYDFSLPRSQSPNGRYTFFFKADPDDPLTHLLEEEHSTRWNDFVARTNRSSAPQQMFLAPGNTYDFRFGSTEYLGLIETSEEDFYQEGHDQGLMVRGGPRPKPCAHEPGATLIRGHVICRKCGIDLN